MKKVCKTTWYSPLTDEPNDKEQVFCILDDEEPMACIYRNGRFMSRAPQTLTANGRLFREDVTEFVRCWSRIPKNIFE